MKSPEYGWRPFLGESLNGISSKDNLDRLKILAAYGFLYGLLVRGALGEMNTQKVIIALSPYLIEGGRQVFMGVRRNRRNRREAPRA